MTITTNASYDQLNSPYYLENQQLGQLWENLSNSYNGTIQGTYNAWSCRYSISLPISGGIQIEVEKSTFSGANLMLSSKFQNLKEILTLTIPVHSSEQFKIDESTWYQFTRKRIFNSAYKFKGKRSPLANDLIQLLKPYFKKNLVNSILCEKGKLKVELRHQNANIELVEECMDLFNSETKSQVS